MKEIELEGGTIDTAELWRALAEFETGELDSVQRDELMALIGRSPAAQRSYLDYFQMTAMLGAEASTFAEKGKLPVVMGQRRLANRVFRRSLLTAAAVLVLTAIAATFFKVRQIESGQLAVSATAGAKWAVDGMLQDPAADRGKVAAGSSLKVWSGMVELKLESGAKFVLQGPAHASFPESDRPVLHAGWLWVDSEEVGEPLEVETPGLLVRDIGTRFAVRVPEEGPAEVHLVEGRVDVFAKATNEMLISLKPEERAHAIPAEGEMKVLSLARDPFPDLGDLFEAPANYATTVKSQNPAGYWRMNGDEAGVFPNEVSGGLVGRCHPRAATSDSGPGPANGYRGFGEGNRSALAPAHGRESLSLGSILDHDGLLFEDDFSEEGGELDGAMPDVTVDSTRWVSSPAFNRDGTTNSSKGSASLAFTPFDGTIYTLDATVTATSGPSEDWIGMGFGRALSARLPRIGSGGMAGNVWMLHRAEDSTKPVNRAWLSTSASDWDWPAGSPVGGTMDMRIVLDTTEGPGGWTATWYAKRPADEVYHKVRDTEVLINESISCVVLSGMGERISATVEEFSLRAEKQKHNRPERHRADGPSRLSRKEGAVSFWVRCDPGRERPEVLWIAGERRGDASVHAHLTADGRAGLFMENGRYDVLVASEDSIDDGEWHHLVASWSPDSVDLYIDGKQVARDTEFRGMQRGLLPELRFGGDSKDAGLESFNGSFDEIAVWDRPLTFTEVVHQFRSAQGR